MLQFLLACPSVTNAHSQEQSLAVWARGPLFRYGHHVRDTDSVLGAEDKQGRNWKCQVFLQEFRVRNSLNVGVVALYIWRADAKPSDSN